MDRDNAWIALCKPWIGSRQELIVQPMERSIIDQLVETHI